jgi:hypothetical protein
VIPSRLRPNQINLGISIDRLRALSCGSWRSFLHTRRFKRRPMLNWTAWSAETVGQVQMMSSAFHTSEPSSRRYAEIRAISGLVWLLTPVCFLRWNAHIRHFGWRRRTIQQKTLYIMGCTFRKTRELFSIATKSTITRRSIQTRKHHYPPSDLVSKRCAADKDVLFSIDSLSTLNASWATR